MVFSSVLFLCFFLPAVLLVYYVAPKKLKNAVLFLFSLVFYFAGEGNMLWLMLSVVIFNYFAARLIDRFRTKTRSAKSIFVLSVTTDFAILIYFKYTDFLIDTANAVLGAELQPLNMALPIAISFYIFQTVSYLIDVYKGTVPVQKNLLKLAAYITMFAQLIAGPIVRYSDIYRELDDRTHTFDGFSYGIRRFAVGLSKKVLLANSFAELVKTASVSDEKSVLLYWIWALAFTFQIYFDFSGYSDMAIGLGKMFGFHFPENFKYPFVSASITDFWRRWHITLSSWFRDYVYIPLGGNKKGTIRQLINIVIVWTLAGAWHGAAWNFVLWGLYYAVLLIAEKLFLGKLLKKLPKILGILYTAFLTVIGFVLFSADGLSEVITRIGGMFGIGVTEIGCESLYFLRSYAVTFLIAAVASTPLGNYVYGKLCSSGFCAISEPAVCSVLIILPIAYLIDGSFNPFLYFRF